MVGNKPRGSFRVSTYVLAIPVVPYEPVKCVVAVGPVAVTGSIKADVLLSLGGVAVSEIHIRVERDAGPTGFLQDAAKPSLSAAVDGAFQKGRRPRFLGAGSLQRIGTLSDGRGVLALVVSSVAEGLGIIDVQGSGVVTALLVVRRKDRLHPAFAGSETQMGATTSGKSQDKNKKIRSVENNHHKRCCVPIAGCCFKSNRMRFFWIGK